jgi:hypothetical protein
MRIVVGVSVLVAALGVLPSIAVASPAELVASLPQAAVGRSTPVEAKLAPDFRVRGDVLTTSASLDPFADPSGQMRHRFASSMIDYYPLGGSGFRVSAGMRFFAVPNFLKDAEKATAGLLYNPRQLGSGAGIRTGFNRRTPAATLGYTGTIKNAMFGFEVGSLLGNANATMPRAMRMLSDRGTGGVNPIANVVVGLRF